MKLANAGYLDSLPTRGSPSAPAFRAPAAEARVLEICKENEATEIRVAQKQMGVTAPDLDGWAYAAAMGLGGKVTGS